MVDQCAEPAMLAMKKPPVDRVLQLLDANGTLEREMVLIEESIEIGRIGSGFACPDDAAMADRHASVTMSDDERR